MTFFSTARRWACWLGLASITALPALANTAGQVQQFTLENGMQILVLEDHSIPNANMYLFWKVGSRNEAPGITGISHFFEHMMFNGSKKYGPKMFDQVMEAAGGANNAYTTENLTVYTNWFPNTALETIFDLEADRIADLDIDPDMVASETGVVISERSTGLENSNYRTLSEALKGVAFQAHPYSWSVIGHESDIQSWDIKDLEQYHKTYYAPNNAVVVIAGAVTLAEVKRLAEQYFAPIPAQPAPRAVKTVEPEQTGERRVFVTKASATSANIMLGYHVPATSDADYYALELLSTILSSGNSSRLHQALVEQQLATNVFTNVPLSFDPNLFYIYAVARPGVAASTLEQALLQALSALAQNGVTANELEKAKNIQLMNFYREMQTINGKADNIGTYQLYFGDYRKLYQTAELFNQVSAADIQRVAARYLTRANRTVGILAANEETDQ
ncbi:insulinase family protein [Alishewanella sp. 16-MA]|uniref:Insulinase family protein n=1 Tax=Alishewanella maricola TaxID=2795740 RepID=A0ABS8C2X0_9ALTE|nr:MULTISPECIES: pitrilysin family protein [Gammaproteobacteria]MDP4945970.1 insulinase family protein [Alishewanella sp.]MCB5226683.1 insulinase family protein [Alishewanella maricola]MCC5451083.1 insulinase family protein [Rheinheimera sp. UJ51]MCF4007847.1 insulinase family protein [Rheinheimera sp. UJ63]MDP5187191.1 insulinase family protein [Alishewanella sp.]